MRLRHPGKKGRPAFVIKRAFFWCEPPQFIGGPGGYLDGMITSAEKDLVEGGAIPPFGVRFSGGDGKMEPVIMEVFEA